LWKKVSEYLNSLLKVFGELFTASLPIKKCKISNENKVELHKIFIWNEKSGRGSIAGWFPKVYILFNFQFETLRIEKLKFNWLLSKLFFFNLANNRKFEFYRLLYNSLKAIWGKEGYKYLHNCKYAKWVKKTFDRLKMTPNWLKPNFDKYELNYFFLSFCGTESIWIQAMLVLTTPAHKEIFPHFKLSFLKGSLDCHF